MTIFINIIILIAGAFIGIICYLKVQYYKEERKAKRQVLDNHKISCEECDLDIIKEEWKTTIDTQMHFNDLIIKFRSVVLSVFIASLGFIFGLSKQLDMDNADFLLLIGLAFSFWICSFLLDYFYYHKLLLGAVEHAKKFDDSDYFKAKGMFGLTRRISFEVEPIVSKMLILGFYLVPIAALLCILIYKHFKLIP